MVKVKVIIGERDKFTVTKQNDWPNLIDRYELIHTILEVVDAVNVAYEPHQKKEYDLRRLLMEKLIEDKAKEDKK